MSDYPAQLGLKKISRIPVDAYQVQLPFSLLLLQQIIRAALTDAFSIDCTALTS